MEEKQYRGIDVFRMAAALMVVAIHIAPLSIVSDRLDFLITYCAFRVAVPFFFMVTGYFVIGPCMADNGRHTAGVRKYYWKSIILYLGATLLFLPVNIYSGNLPQNLWDGLKWFFFDGTFYHLWYFPAVMIGGLLLLAVSKISVKCAVWVSAITYCLGVLGDSWYGLAKELPLLNELYDKIFTISSYTRNGVFFAPLFILMGALAGKQRPSKRICKYGLILSFLLMLAEGYATYTWNIQKHNSMYFLLPFVMFFLFQLLLDVKGQAVKWLRGCSTWIYVLHPAIIVLLRGVAKFAGQTKWMIDNTLIEYALVCLISLLISLALQLLWKRGKHRCTKKAGPGLN